MKLTLVPETILERLAVLTHQVPMPMAVPFASLTSSRVMTACAALGFFDLLASRPCTVKELIDTLELDPEATSRTVDCLLVGEVIEWEGTRLRLAKPVRKWLDPASPTTVLNFLKHSDDLWRMWVHLPMLLKHGSRAEAYQSMLRGQEGEQQWGTHDESQLRRHLAGLGDMARLQSRELLFKLRLPKGPGRVLDIGAGHAQYLIGILKARPEYQGVDFDLPLSARIGAEEVAKAGLTDRIQVVPGDLFADDLEQKVGREFTQVLYFNILHNLSEAQNRRALEQIARVTAKGGRVLLWDMYRAEKGGTTDPLASVFALQMMFGTAGNTFRVQEVQGWLEEAGFGGVKEITLASVPGTAIVAAVRK